MIGWHHDGMLARTEQGFTLIELSIVLVIIGLISGAVLVGRDLIHSSTLNKMVKQEEQFRAAFMVFRNKYNCLPGDCSTADQFFGASCGDNTTSATTGCNGNGDGAINVAGLAMGEHLKFWMHLSQAKLLGGNYSGRGNATFYGPAAKINVNTPPTVIAGLGWNSIISGEASSIGGASDIPANAWGFSYGGDNMTTDYHQLFDAPFLSRTDAYYIDNKADDGFPDTGRVRGDMRGDCNSGGDPNMNTYFANGITPPATPDSIKDCQQSFLY